MVLTVKQIAALDWVVQLGGFANAAERLNTTQSANTKRIQELETSSISQPARTPG
ncbi:hypothetical protein BOTU111922_26270 [Bordetella tumulicola]